MQVGLRGSQTDAQVSKRTQTGTRLLAHVPGIIQDVYHIFFMPLGTSLEALGRVWSGPLKTRLLDPVLDPISLETLKQGGRPYGRPQGLFLWPRRGFFLLLNSSKGAGHLGFGLGVVLHIKGLYTRVRSSIVLRDLQPSEFLREERLFAVQGGFLCCSHGGRQCPPTSTRSGKHNRRIRGSSSEHSSSFSSPIFALPAKIRSFFVKDVIDQSYRV